MRVLPDGKTRKPTVYSMDFVRLGVMEKAPQQSAAGVFLAKVGSDGKTLIGEYVGP